jgi:hypothetical protein
LEEAREAQPDFGFGRNDRYAEFAGRWSFSMMESRREFITLFMVSGVPLLVLDCTTEAQAQQSGTGQKPGQRDKEEDTGEPKFDSKAMLAANQKNIKKDIERLFQLATELKAEVEKTDSVKMLSVAMLKKAEEIEKLAKEIRSRAVG